MGDKDRMKGWTKGWEEGKIAFHRPALNENLENCYHQLAADGRPVRILVPLCGKSVDMMWLYEKGHTVIGIEGVEQAIVEFFSENKLQFNKSQAGSASLFQTEDGRLQIYQADICELSTELVGPVQGIWDCSSYVAMEYHDRPSYAAFIRGVMAPECRYLLWALEFDRNLHGGPPHSLTRQDIDIEFGDANIECLTCTDHTTETFPRMAKWNLTKMAEKVYLITLK